MDTVVKGGYIHYRAVKPAQGIQPRILHGERRFILSNGARWTGA
ncbi:MAG: hypothetical protein WA109_12960 [Bellilinea sp.]